MNASDTRSLSQIRRDTEQTRAALTSTVEELRGTVSDTASDLKNRLQPDAIKAEVTGYIKSRGQQLMHDMTEAARRNPMQAVAVGAGLAYPALKIARSVPLPVLMIGAGLFFAGSKTGQELTQKASDAVADASEEAGRRIDQLRTQASQLGDQATRAMSDLRDRAGQAIGQAGDAIAGSASQASDKASQLAATTSDLASASADTAQDATTQLTDAVRHAQSRLAESGRQVLETTREQIAGAGESLTEAGRKTADTVRESVQNNPLLVAGLGLLVGGLIASVLPRSDAEGRVLGDASRAVRRKAREAAEAGFETARGATGEIIAKAAQQASAEGLTPDRLAEGAQDVGRRLQAVAERAVTTAFEPQQANERQNEPQQQNDTKGGGRRNG